jgi:hypothetical protein
LLLKKVITKVALKKVITKVALKQVITNVFHLLLKTLKQTKKSRQHFTSEKVITNVCFKKSLSNGPSRFWVLDLSADEHVVVRLCWRVEPTRAYAAVS